MSLIGNPDTPASYVADYMQACVGMFGIPAGGFTSDIETYGAATNYDVESLYAAMLNSSIGRSIYAPGISNESFATKLVDKVGGGLLSDANKAAAIDEVQALLDGGLSHAATAMAVVEFVAGLETTDATYGAVAQQFQNRITIANYYTFQGTNPSSTLSTLQGVLSGVINTTDVSDPEAVIDDATTPGVSTGQTFSLVKDVIDNIIGTTGNDTIIGDNNSTSAADSVAGGAGTDTLKLYDTVTLPTLSGVEALYLNSPDGDMNISTKSEITSLTIENQVTEDDNDFTIASGQAITLKSITEGTAAEDLDILSAAAVTTVGLTVDTVGTSTTDVDVDIEGTGVTTLNLTASGAASYFSLQNTGAAITTINIAGDKVATINLDDDSNGGAITSNATTIAVTNTAGAVVTTDDDASKNITFTGGAGNDTVYFGTEFNVNDSATGGDGTDTIGIADGADLTSTSGAKATGFEKLSVKGGTGSYDMDYLSGITQVIASGGAGAVTIVDLAVGADVVVAAALAGGTLTINQKDAGAGSPDDTLTVTVDGAAGFTTGQTIDVNDIETVTLKTTSSGVSQTQTISNLTATEATSVKVDASTAAATISALSAAAAVLFDASSSAKAVSLTVGANGFTSTSGIAFKGGAGSDTFTLTAVTDFSSTANDATVIINGGAGGDAYVLAADDGSTVGNGHTDGEAYTFQFADGDSVSVAGATYGYDTTKMDEISGIDSTTAFAATTDAAGSKFTLDTAQTASAATFSTTAVTFGTTTVTNAYDFYVFDNNANTANTAYIYQDTDGDKIIEAGEFGILITGTAQFATGEFTVTSGNLVFAST